MRSSPHSSSIKTATPFLYPAKQIRVLDSAAPATVISRLLRAKISSSHSHAVLQQIQALFLKCPKVLKTSTNNTSNALNMANDSTRKWRFDYDGDVIMWNTLTPHLPTEIIAIIAEHCDVSATKELRLASRACEYASRPIFESFF